MFKSMIITLSMLFSFSVFSLDKIVLTPENHILIADEINPDSVEEASKLLSDMSTTLPETATITIVLDSPGGSVFAGNDLIDLIDSVPQKVRIVCMNAASMAFSIFQHGDERLITQKGLLMQHRPSITLSGPFNTGEVETRLKMFTTITNEQIKFESSKMGLTEKEFRDLVHDELWLMGQEAVDKKAADNVIKLTCSKELMKSVYQGSIDTIFGPMSYKRSACPLVKGIYDVKMERD